MENISEKLISSLIEKYFNAETSLSEEALIKRYYRETPDVEMSNELRQYRDMFALYEREAVLINDRAARTQPRKTLFMNHQLMKWGSVAAAAIILIALFVTNPRQSDTLRFVIDGENINDKELALSFAGSKMDKINELMKRLEKSEEYMGTVSKAEKPVSSLDKLNKVLSQS